MTDETAPQLLNGEAREHYERLLTMIEDDGETWDLSDNDKAALRWATKFIADVPSPPAARRGAPR